MNKKKYERILLSHGGGGKETSELIGDIIFNGLYGQDAANGYFYGSHNGNMMNNGGILNESGGISTDISNQKINLLEDAAVLESPQKIAFTTDSFTVRDEFEWRGFGNIPKSGLKLRDEFKDFDAEYVFNDKLKELELRSNKKTAGRENAACKCGEILKGKSKPDDCQLFGKACNPENPVGACMVSFEGACAAYYKYRNF